MAILFGIIAGVATLMGMWIVVSREAWARRNAVYLIAFAIGVLLTTALTDIIPEAQELTPNAFLIVLGTFFVFYVLEHSILAHHDYLHGAEESGPGHPRAHIPVEKLAFVGLAVHSLVDGLAIGAGFEVSVGLGILATLAVVLHEVPEGITSVALFLHANYPRRRAITLTAIVALATPFGALLTAVIPSLVTPSALGVLLAVAGGSFLYVATTELIPETHHAKHVPAILLMCGGLVLPLLVNRLLGA